jgi:polyhydroxyalkanoic acid synthase PhaR subunit
MAQMLDPFGLWKTSRDTMLDAWSKTMIDVVNSDEYARSTGMLLDQYLAMSQPLQDAVQKGMTATLAYVNMPTREEVLSLAERLVNIETRLDDLDAKTSDMRDDYREGLRTVERRVDKAEERVAASEKAMIKEIGSVNGSLDKVLSAIMARLDKLEAAVVQAREKSPAEPRPKAEAKPDAKPEPKTDTKK